MSSGFDLIVLGAPLKKFWICTSLLFTLSVFPVSCILLCSIRQSLNRFNPTVSMPLRPKRICSGVECFGGSHIVQFSNCFLLLRVDLT
ncbi:hypothetical protein Lal_00047200 [Lupinus albus]|nr:hypothetical protein Lal_00047200 [Lupinus albus]